MIAALFVQTGGAYWNLPGVDPWDEQRDARRYAGPHPVVAHPPCSRFCRLAYLVEARWGHRVGDDGGCFSSALASVRSWGGVLEHPAESLAWRMYGLLEPSRAGGWSRSLLRPSEWVCQVAQSAYGHRARKLTWLLYVGANPPPELDWSQPEGDAVVGHMTYRGDGTAFTTNGKQRLWKREASATPAAFRDVLLALAERSQAATAKGAA